MKIAMTRDLSRSSVSGVFFLRTDQARSSIQKNAATTVMTKNAPTAERAPGSGSITSVFILL